MVLVSGVWMLARLMCTARAFFLTGSVLGGDGAPGFLARERYSRVVGMETGGLTSLCEGECYERQSDRLLLCVRPLHRSVITRLGSAFVGVSPLFLGVPDSYTEPQQPYPDATGSNRSKRTNRPSGTTRHHGWPEPPAPQPRVTPAGCALPWSGFGVEGRGVFGRPGAGGAGD